MQFGPADIEAFVIAFARVGAMMMLIPGLGERAIPSRHRLIISLAVTLIAYPGVREALGAKAGGFAIARMLGELGIGLAIGMCARLVMAAMETAGSLTSQSVGLSFAQMYDPSQGQQGEVIVTFLRMLGIALIFAGDLHHVAIAGIVGSYQAMPVGSVVATGDMLTLFVRLVGEVFRTGLALAAPFVAFGFIFNVGVGLASKMAPQIQLFYITMPLSIMLGLGAIVLAAPLLATRFSEFARGMFLTLLAGH